MNKGIWKLLTLLGFILAVIVVGMILVLRFQIFDRFGGFSFNRTLPQTQELSQQTQLTTEEQVLSDLNLDKKNLDRLQQGCLSGNDCIPTIDEPKFVSAKQAYRFLKDDDLVIGVAFEGWEKEDDPVKAYPVKIMNWHEVVNDFLNETPVAVTYSPLTMTPRVFQTLSGGAVNPLGVSGMLLNSNSVLYDKETKSLWSQFDGLALAGPKRGEKLVPYLYPSQLMRWGDWVKQYPKTAVLSEDTGSSFDYNESPYGDYGKTADIYFPLEHTDTRMAAKETVFGIVIGDQAKVYPEIELKKALPNGGTFTDEFAGKKLTVSYNKNMFSAVDTQTKEQFSGTVSYYFAWAAFYPNLQIYQAPEQAPAEVPVKGELKTT